MCPIYAILPNSYDKSGNFYFYEKYLKTEKIRKNKGMFDWFYNDH